MVLAIKVVSEERYRGIAVHKHEISRDMAHPCVVSIREIFRGEQGKVALIQDYVSGGDLYEWLDAGMTEADVHSVLSDVIAGVE